MTPRKILLTIQYDGADYHGWAIQPDTATVQQQLCDAVSSLLGRKIFVHGASRTDAQVSALGQKGLFEVIDCPIPTENFAKAINDRLPDNIVITEAVEAPPKFDLIGAVKNKLYRYTIYTGPLRPILDIRHCWHVPANLNIEAMNKAAAFLVGRHDFKSFASAKDTREDSTRTIFLCQAADSSVITARQAIYNCPYDPQQANSWIYIDVQGDGFLYNMVRNIVGSLVEVGIGRWKPDKMKDVLQAKDRTAAGPIAPPQGLCLMWIKY
ncbi:MAG: tRNA pseudouridine(38-40) synthase TruA [Phycisphaerae bacterium]